MSHCLVLELGVLLATVDENVVVVVCIKHLDVLLKMRVEHIWIKSILIDQFLQIGV